MAFSEAGASGGSDFSVKGSTEQRGWGQRPSTGGAEEEVIVAGLKAGLDVELRASAEELEVPGTDEPQACSAPLEACGCPHGAEEWATGQQALKGSGGAWGWSRGPSELPGTSVKGGCG